MLLGTKLTFLSSCPRSAVLSACVFLLWSICATGAKAQSVVFSTPFGNLPAMRAYSTDQGDIPNQLGKFVSENLMLLGFEHNFSMTSEGHAELERAISEFRRSRGYRHQQSILGGEIAMIERLATGALNVPNAELLLLIQNALMFMGHFDGLRDGVWGSDSEAALQEFRREHILPRTSGVTAEDIFLLFLFHNGKLTQPDQTTVIVPPPPPPPRPTAVSPPNKITPTRAFSGPDQYPPGGFKGYGVLAFKSIATSYDIDRHRLICQAYTSAFLNTAETAEPKVSQFLTIWPVRSSNSADKLNNQRDLLRIIAADPKEDPICELAIKDYDLSTAASALNAAKEAGFEDDGRTGPFLLAWSPSSDFGSSDTFVLSLDLTGVTSFEQAQAMMQSWKADIESDFELLANGFSIDKLRTKIRRWADRHGEGFLVIWTRDK